MAAVLSPPPWKVSEHRNNLLSGNSSFFFQFLFVFFFFYKITYTWQIPPTSAPLPTPFFYIQKQTNAKDFRGISTVNTVKIDTYDPYMLKHIRKGLFFQKARNILVGVPHSVRPAEFKQCVQRGTAQVYARCLCVQCI